MRFAILAGIALRLSPSPSPVDAAPNLITCGATTTGVAILTADLVCPSGHGLVVGTTPCSIAQVVASREVTARGNTASTSATARARW